VQLIGALNALDEMSPPRCSGRRTSGRSGCSTQFTRRLYFAKTGWLYPANIPLSREESQFLIGLVFRYTLMSVIVDSQRRDNLGVLKVNPIPSSVKNPTMKSARSATRNTWDRFVIPYLIKTGRGTNRDTLLAATDLENGTQYLRNIPRCVCRSARMISCCRTRNISWYRTNLGTNLTVYPVGGHLGNLHVPAVQEKLVRLFSE